MRYARAKLGSVRRPSLDAVRGFDRAVYTIAVAQLVNVFGSGLVYPFATIHFHLEVGIPLAIVGLGLGAKSAMTAVGTAVGGYLTDQIGRKPVMVTAMATSAVTLAAFAFVPVLGTAVPEPVTAYMGVSAVGTAFIIVGALSGMTVGLYPPAAQAMTADLTSDKDRDRGYALLKFANNIGFGSGFVVGGVLYATAGVAVFILDGLTSGIVALVLLLSLPNSHGGQTVGETSHSLDSRPEASPEGGGAIGTFRDWWDAASRARVVLLAAINIGFAMMYAQMQATVPVIAKGRLGLTSAQVGTLYVLNPLTLVIFQLPLVDAVSEWRRTRGLVVSGALWAASMLAALAADLGVGPVAAGVAFVGVHLVVRTLGEVLHSPLVTALMSDLGAVDQRGTQLSLLEVAKRVGMGAGAFIGGFFFDAGLSVYLWPTLIGVCGLMIGGLFLLERRVSPRENGRMSTPDLAD